MLSFKQTKFELYPKLNEIDLYLEREREREISTASTAATSYKIMDIVIIC